MRRNIYAIRVDRDRIVAAEVSDAVAAMLFDDGGALLLATEAELAALARRDKKLLTVLRCDQPQRGPQRTPAQRADDGWTAAKPTTPPASRDAAYGPGAKRVA